MTDGGQLVRASDDHEHVNVLQYCIIAGSDWGKSGMKREAWNNTK